MLHYSKGSKDLEIRKGTYATLASVDPKENRITVSQDGRKTTYDPKRLQGISAYQEIHRDFARGDQIQFTAPIRELGIANRERATIEKIHGSELKIRIDGEGKRSLTFNAQKMRHFDHCYAVTSHSSQGITARARAHQHGYEKARGADQCQIRLRLRLASLARRSDLHQRRAVTRSAAQPRRDEDICGRIQARHLLRFTGVLQFSS